ncbi:hypothetical protein acdb102_28490 [Acidothermaceae bacterium B102]|nr:hypothetical protein acdb102_28490 [Acidothermaceae bacterium B102]
MQDKQPDGRHTAADGHPERRPAMQSPLIDDARGNCLDGQSFRVAIMLDDGDIAHAGFIRFSLALPDARAPQLPAPGPV